MKHPSTAQPNEEISGLIHPRLDRLEVEDETVAFVSSFALVRELVRVAVPEAGAVAGAVAGAEVGGVGAGADTLEPVFSGAASSSSSVSSCNEYRRVPKVNNA